MLVEDVMDKYMAPETVGLLFRCFISSMSDSRWNSSIILLDAGSGMDLEAACRSKVEATANLIGGPPEDLVYGYYNSLAGVLRPYDVRRHLME